LHDAVLQWRVLRHRRNVLQWVVLPEWPDLLQRNHLLRQRTGLHRQWVLHPCQPIHDLCW
jgi:hypothetical protein